MLTHIENGSFACLAFRTRGLSNTTTALQLTDSVYVSHDSPFVMDEFWRTHLGEISISKLEESTIYLTAVSDVNDLENSLKSHLHSLHHGLLLQGVGYNAIGYLQGGMILGGPIVDGKLQVQSVGDMMHHREPYNVITKAVDESSLRKAIEIANGIEEIYADQTGSNYLRIRKGFQEYINGTMATFRHERIHHFVSSIEALLRPTEGNYKKHFAARSIYFLGDPNDDKSLLQDLYELRSVAEHLNPMLSALNRIPEHERHDEIHKRNYQAELLAAFAYRKILTNPVYRQVFISDESITSLWQRQMPDLISFWGNDFVDLENISQQDGFEYIGYWDFLNS